MKTNKKMDKILNIFFTTSLDVSLEQIVDKSIIEPKFKIINGCILIDNQDEIDEDTLDWTIILNNYWSKTAFEASVNEVRINDYINDENLKDYELVKLGILVFENWRKSIKKLIEPNECEFIMSLNDGYLTMRICLIREDEESLYNGDLEGFKEEAMSIF